MAQLGQAISSFTESQMIPLAATVIIAVIVVIGFALIVGTRQMTDWAKNHIFQVIGGTVLIYLAANIAQSFISSLGYSGF